MDDNKKAVKQFTCPACFAREIDVILLHYDEECEEYYCTKCAYTGKRENVEHFFQVLQEEKYKAMDVPHGEANTK